MSDAFLAPLPRAGLCFRRSRHLNPLHGSPEGDMRVPCRVSAILLNDPPGQNPWRGVSRLCWSAGQVMFVAGRGASGSGRRALPSPKAVWQRGPGRQRVVPTA